jgi:hypothetical protein
MKKKFLFFFIFAGWSTKKLTSLVEIVNTFHLVGTEEKPTFQRGFGHVVGLVDIGGRSFERPEEDNKSEESFTISSDISNIAILLSYTAFLNVVWNYLYIRLTFYKYLILIKITFRRKKNYNLYKLYPCILHVQIVFIKNMY